MRFHAGEIGGLVLGAMIVVVALVGAAGLLRSRSRIRRDRDALGDALAASEAVSAALSEEALFLSAVLSAVDSAIVLFDRSSRVRFVNERFDDLFGLRSDAVVGRSRDQFVEEIVSCFRDPQVFREVAFGDEDERASGPRTTRHSGVAAPDEIELMLERPNRKVVLFSLVPVLQGDRRIGVLAMFRDVTAQRAAEDARERLLAELAARGPRPGRRSAIAWVSAAGSGPASTSTPALARRATRGATQLHARRTNSVRPGASKSPDVTTNGSAEERDTANAGGCSCAHADASPLSRPLSRVVCDTRPPS
jgi:PAS domain S-box-containing protein